MSAYGGYGGREKEGHGWMSTTEIANLVDDVERAATAETEAQRQLREVVREARRRGLTWEQVGAGLGVTKQAAAKRFRSDHPMTSYTDRPLSN